MCDEHSHWATGKADDLAVTISQETCHIWPYWSELKGSIHDHEALIRRKNTEKHLQKNSEDDRQW